MLHHQAHATKQGHSTARGAKKQAESEFLSRRSGLIGSRPRERPLGIEWDRMKIVEADGDLAPRHDQPSQKAARATDRLNASECDRALLHQ